MEITINQNDNQLISISNNNLQQIGIEQNDNQLITINNSNSQDIGINQNENQTILIDGGGVVIGITDVLVNGVSVVSGNTAYVIVPTRTSELINNSGYITNETDPTVPSYVKAISLADINNWNNKQDLLVSGSNIKTINNTSLLGSGNIDIQSGSSYSAGTGIDITNNVISNTITSYNDLTDLPTIPTQTSQLLNDSDFVSEDDLSEVAFTGSYASLSDTPEIPNATSDLTNDGDGTYPFLLNKSSGYIDGIGTLGGSTAQARNLAYTWDNGVIQESHTVANYDDLTNELATKQDTLVSGTNIKTINNESILGSGNINISGGGSTDVQINGTSIVSNDIANIITESAYNSSTNKIATVNDIHKPIAETTLTSNSATLELNNLSLEPGKLYKIIIAEYSTSSSIQGHLIKINNNTVYKGIGIVNGNSIFNYSASLGYANGWNMGTALFFTSGELQIFNPDWIAWNGNSICNVYDNSNMVMVNQGSCLTMKSVNPVTKISVEPLDGDLIGIGSYIKIYEI